MTRASSPQLDHLHLVESSEPELPPVLTDPAARKVFEQLTEALIEAVIEIMDLADGDPDLEPDADDEDSDGT